MFRIIGLTRIAEGTITKESGTWASEDNIQEKTNTTRMFSGRVNWT